MAVKIVTLIIHGEQWSARIHDSYIVLFQITPAA